MPPESPDQLVYVCSILLLLQESFALQAPLSLNLPVKQSKQCETTQTITSTKDISIYSRVCTKRGFLQQDTNSASLHRAAEIYKVPEHSGALLLERALAMMVMVMIGNDGHVAVD